MKQVLHIGLFLFVYFFSTNFLFAQSDLPDEVKIVYSASNLPVSQVIKEISRKSGVNISFQDEIFQEDKLVTVISRGKPVGRVLEDILKDTGVKYRIIGNQIVLVKTENIDESQEFTISGYISDAISGEKLPFGSVYLHDKSSGTTANEYGFYSFKVKAGEKHIYYSYLGYKIEIVDITIKKDEQINTLLNPNVQLNEVIVIESAETAESENADVEEISVDELRSSVPLAGEPDVLRMSYMKSGINTGADGFGGMSVRGGSINHNLIMLDGIPVYNVNHALGVFSIFNSDVVKSTKLYKAGFPSRYSGRLSSVLDVITREGNDKEFRTNASIGLISAKASIEGPLVKNQSSFLLSARRTYLDPWINLYSRNTSSENETNDTRAYFYDMNGKMNFTLNKRNKLFVSFFNGKDLFQNNVADIDVLNKIKDETNLEWEFQNTLGTVRWNWQASNALFLKSSLYITRYNFEAFDLVNYERENVQDSVTTRLFRAKLFNTQIQDIGIKTNVDWIYSNKHTFRFGYDFVRHRYRPGLYITENIEGEIPLDEEVTKSGIYSLFDQETFKGNEVRFYIEDQIKLSPRWRLNIGINQAFHIVDSTTYAVPEPRASLMYENGGTLIRASYSRLSQFSHLLSNTGVGLPLDVWVPTTSRIPPEKAWISSLELHQQLSKTTSCGLEFYYKKLSDLARFNEGSSLDIAEFRNWQTSIPIGKGTAYGVEASLVKDLGRFTFGANYTWSKALRHFEGFAKMDTFYYRFDRRHAVKLNMIYSLNDNVEMSVNWVYGSGNPISTPEDYREILLPNGDVTVILMYDGKNDVRLQPYHRMDVGISIFNNYSWGRQKITFGAYNAYNRRNPLYIDLVRDFEPPQFGLEGISFLAIVPTFSFSMSF